MNNRTGEIIEKYRREKGYTQGELAKKLGVSNTAISKWEHGYNLPDIALLEPISKILGIDMMLLLTSEYEEKEENRPKNKQKKMNLFIGITLVILLFLSVIASISLLISNHYNKKIEKIKEEQVQAYRFYNDTGDFLVNGYIFFNNKDSVVVLDYIKHQSKSKSSLNQDITSIELYMYVDNERVLSRKIDNVKKEYKNINELLDKITIISKLEKENLNCIKDKNLISIKITSESGQIIEKNILVKLQPII